MAKKMIRPIRTEAEYDAALEEIERYFENEPKPGTPEATCSRWMQPYPRLSCTTMSSLIPSMTDVAISEFIIR